MGDRTLIVARMTPGSAEHIGSLFAESDATSLPVDLGVRRRHLFAYRGLYFHYIEFAGDRGDALSAAGGRDDFNQLSRDLAAHVLPYDPNTWRSPHDAMAQEFYRWTSPHQER
jgi:hypothetical protein